jgi:hypothetical protein
MRATTHIPQTAKKCLIRSKNFQQGPAVALCHYEYEVSIEKLPAHQDPNKNDTYQATSIRYRQYIGKE